MDIKIDIEDVGISRETLEVSRPAAGKVLDSLWSDQGDNGWVQAPLHQDREELERILNIADILKQEAEMMVVIGTANATLPARAAVSALPNTLDGIDIRFVGHDFCQDSMRRILMEMSRRGTVVCVVSKTGEEPEIQAALSVMEALMEKKYGSREFASRRTIVITEAGSELYKEAEKEGYIIFEYPADVKELYGALTPAGLFPMAVAGIDIRDFIDGARAMATSPKWDTDGTDYAAARAVLRQSRQIERMGTFDTRFEELCRWLKKLCESRGDVKCTVINESFYEAAGGDMIFETVISAEDGAEGNDAITIPTGHLSGRTIEMISRELTETRMDSIRKSGCASLKLQLPKAEPFYYGQLIYFLQTSCEITAEL
ncbi:MAG: hypothetical protein Q4C46_04915 [Bacillota bacterium]|nr:hypothetical protein [Bacillota bacterium]